jgi:hypothetical protein
MQRQAHALAEKRERIYHVALTRAVLADKKQWIGKLDRVGSDAPEAAQHQPANV